jgi:hypothetical protein
MMMMTATALSDDDEGEEKKSGNHLQLFLSFHRLSLSFSDMEAL